MSTASKTVSQHAAAGAANGFEVSDSKTLLFLIWQRVRGLNMPFTYARYHAFGPHVAEMS